MTEVIVKLQDNEYLVIPKKAAQQSETFKKMIDRNDPWVKDPVIELEFINDVGSFKLCMDWCRHHAHDSAECSDNDSDDFELELLPSWDQRFFKNNEDTLADIIATAKFFQINQLYKVGVKYIANMVQDKSPEEIWTLFGL